jgi:hypothetical protein
MTLGDRHATSATHAPFIECTTVSGVENCPRLIVTTASSTRNAASARGYGPGPTTWINNAN